MDTDANSVNMRDGFNAFRLANLIVVSRKARSSLQGFGNDYFFKRIFPISYEITDTSNCWTFALFA
jgi:hypothetical protein